MKRLSLCLIVKNEEAVLRRCLESVQGVYDELIIVDTGSTDKTVAIAQEFTDKVFHFTWVDDFAKARNFSFSKATMEYLMWLDADDIMKEADKEKLLELKKSDEDFDIAMFKYDMLTGNKDTPELTYYRERIVKKARNPVWMDPIHEFIAIAGHKKYYDIAISHKKILVNDPKRNLRIYTKMVDEGRKLTARQKFYYGKELFYTANYKGAIKVLQDHLKDEDAWIENKLDAMITIAECYGNLGKNKLALKSLYETFYLAIPRGEALTRIAHHYFWENAFSQAIYWYKQALAAGAYIDEFRATGAFVNVEYYQFVPAIQLSVCYYRLNNLEQAIIYNELAGTFSPSRNEYLSNKVFYESVKK